MINVYVLGIPQHPAHSQIRELKPLLDEESINESHRSSIGWGLIRYNGEGIRAKRMSIFILGILKRKP